MPVHEGKIESDFNFSWLVKVVRPTGSACVDKKYYLQSSSVLYVTALA